MTKSLQTHRWKLSWCNLLNRKYINKWVSWRICRKLIKPYSSLLGYFLHFILFWNFYNYPDFYQLPTHNIFKKNRGAWKSLIVLIWFKGRDSYCLQCDLKTTRVFILDILNIERSEVYYVPFIQVHLHLRTARGQILISLVY